MPEPLDRLVGNTNDDQDQRDGIRKGREDTGSVVPVCSAAIRRSAGLYLGEPGDAERDEVGEDVSRV